MATLADILSARFAGAVWTLRGDDYPSLQWDPANTVPQPSEAALRAFSDAVDVEIAQDQMMRAQQGRMLSDRPDALLRAIEALTMALQDVRAKLRPAALTGPLDATITTRLDALAQILAAARS